VYHIYNQTQPLAPGEPFIFTLIGEPVEAARPASDGNTGTILIVLVAGAILVFGGMVAWLMLSRKSESNPAA
jgi:hypothetical protein